MRLNVDGKLILFSASALGVMECPVLERNERERVCHREREARHFQFSLSCVLSTEPMPYRCHREAYHTDCGTGG